MTKQARDTLKSLFSSAIRADVLALLLNNAEERFLRQGDSHSLQEKNPSGVRGSSIILKKWGSSRAREVANLKYPGRQEIPLL